MCTVFTCNSAKFFELAEIGILVRSVLLDWLVAVAGDASSGEAVSNGASKKTTGTVLILFPSKKKVIIF